MSYLKKLAGRFPLNRLGLNGKRFSSTTLEELTQQKENDLPPNIQETTSEPILYRDLNFLPKYTKPREVWIENFDSVKEEKRGLIQLHPEIFGTIPRLDLIHANVKWQSLYRKVTCHQAPSRAEVKGTNHRPWPQKGQGRARHADRKAPQFKNGGSAHGPRNPTSYFYTIPYHIRLHGLTSTLSAKFAQDDVKVIDKINLPTDEQQFILDLMKERHWGLSILLVDVPDFMSRNLTIATENLPFVNYMPVYGLNVFSMIKHETLVLTVDAVNEIENKLLKLIHTNDSYEASQRHSYFKKL